jgi:hypothetical protein
VVVLAILWQAAGSKPAVTAGNWTSIKMAESLEKTQSKKAGEGVRNTVSFLCKAEVVSSSSPAAPFS